MYVSRLSRNNQDVKTVEIVHIQKKMQRSCGDLCTQNTNKKQNSKNQLLAFSKSSTSCVIRRTEPSMPNVDALIVKS